MKNIDMHLNDEPFNLIKNDIKTIEYRLNDDKRREIEIGDTITFYKKTDESETIKAIVTELKYYKTLLEMYADTFNRYLYQSYNTPEDAVIDTPYYNEEEIAKYGCVAILFKKL